MMPTNMSTTIAIAMAFSAFDGTRRCGAEARSSRSATAETLMRSSSKGINMSSRDSFFSPWARTRASRRAVVNAARSASSHAPSDAQTIVPRP